MKVLKPGSNGGLGAASSLTGARSGLGEGHAQERLTMREGPRRVHGALASLDAGMDDYVTKPFTRDDLGGVLERWTQPCVDRVAGAGEPAARVPSAPSLDESVLDTLRALEAGGDAGLVARVVAAYLESSGQLFEAARRAREAEDPEAMARAMHTLKSSSAQLGALRLSLLCKDLEARGRAGSLEAVDDLLGQISAELGVVHEGLAVQEFGVRDA